MVSNLQALLSASPYLTTILLLLSWSMLSLLRTRYRKGLKDIPGPVFASILPWNRIYTTYAGNQFRRHLEYHERYGPIVRVGPNHVSIADSQYIPKIYGITSKFFKSDFYTMFHADSTHGRIPTTFSIIDPAGHKALRRPVGAAFALSHLLDLEPLVNECTDIIQRKMDAYQGTVVDLGTWLHWYAFDVVTTITFSCNLNFMEKEEDVRGIIEAIEGRLFYNSITGQVPYMHKWLLGNTFVKKIANLIPSLARLNTSRYIVNFAAEQLEHRKDMKDEGKKDIIANFKQTKDGEEVMDSKVLLSHAVSNVFAGSDTTAISLRAVFYYLCKNPATYNNAVGEILIADKQGELSTHITYAESQHLPYLQACIKEALRLHPAVGQMLERIVPEEGVTVHGTFLPGGTIVGINPWVVARDTMVYGDDANAFRPERWLDVDAPTLKLMDSSWLAFGAGSRTCLGKNVSLMEMSKLIPQLLRRYHVELADPSAKWKLYDYWFVKQEGLRCILTAREI